MYLIRDDNSYDALVGALREGLVVIMACDTIYGFVGRVPDTEAEIRRIKGRGENQPFLILLTDASALPRMGAVGGDDAILSLWPGPFTFIFPTRAHTTVACRVPQDYRLRALIADVGGGLYSTSVNRAGQPPMNDPSEIKAEFGGEVALIEDSGVFKGRLPSTLVDLTRKPRRILRQGEGQVPKKYL